MTTEEISENTILHKLNGEENYSQCVKKSDERVRTLHEELMSREKMKKPTSELKKEVEEKHARAKSRHEAFVAQVVKRAGDEIRRINEVRIITSLNEEKKKLMLRQKLHESELRRAEKLAVMKSKQKENLAREEAVLERKKLVEAEKLQRLAEIQRKKEEAQVRREEERKASSAARKARAIEQLRRKEERAKAQQQQTQLLAQKLAQRLHENEQRRKIYADQIRETIANKFP